ncbi:MAG: glycosyltransferase [Methylovulum sp.]|uniref:glycosyltransferase n=1 Tax=Methylovulum sp. TaxID=1916980 RepID=UPI0026351F38|nr:glycosyltransferase [Methylovulum sp.]MDD2723759.1 glycosyltransferase [Methylovulum sp.]MDD5125260.1 glycosyltransferase [Methylovulum sp.]
MEDAHPADTPAIPEAVQQTFFDQVLNCALLAEQRAGAVVRHLQLAGTFIRVVYAGDTLYRLFSPALAHLEAEIPNLPDITFHIWDSISTQIDMPPPPVPQHCFTDRGDIWGMNSPRIRTAFHWIECSVNLMDLEQKEAVYWVKDASTIPYWCEASPLRTLFHWWMEKQGCQLLHAAALADGENAVLITGKGGVGKSTTALSCLAAGMHYLADDYLVVGLSPEPRVYSLYTSAKLVSGQLQHFPHLAPLVTNMAYLDEEKAVVQLWPAYHPQLCRSLPLKAVVTPCFGATGETVFAPIGYAEVRNAAAFTTLSQLPYAGGKTYAFIDKMLASVPYLSMVLGHDLAAVPRSIRQLLATSPSGLAKLAIAAENHIAASKPLISVIIPVYNGAHFLADAVNNVLTQHYPSLEIIVVDDGSTDDIEAAVGQLPVDVRFFRQENSGAASARNRGIKDVSGEMLAFLDVDDLWPEGNLLMLADMLMADPELDMVHGKGHTLVKNAETQNYECAGNPNESFPYYIGAGLYRRSAFAKIGLFDTELRYAEDTDWFNRAAELQLNIAHLESVTLHVRRHGHNMTAGKTLVELNVLRVFKKTLDRQRAAAQLVTENPDQHENI